MAGPVDKIFEQEGIRVIDVITSPTAANTSMYARNTGADRLLPITFHPVGDASNHEGDVPTVWSSGAPDVGSTVRFIRHRYDDLFRKLAD